MRMEADHLQTGIVREYLDPRPFVPRRWLADEVAEHLGDAACRHILITAGPGMGKSSFLAWLSTRYDFTPRYFIRLDSLTPFASGEQVHLLMSAGEQLALLCPDAFDNQPLKIDVEQHAQSAEAGGTMTALRARRIIANPFRRITIRIRQTGPATGHRVGIDADEVVEDRWLLNPGLLCQLALLDPAGGLAKTHPDSQIVLLIDGVDEIRHQPPSSGSTIMDWLENCPELPANVRVVVTSRPDRQQLAKYRLRQGRRLREISINAGHQRVVDDLRGYANALADDDELDAAMSGIGLSLGDTAHAAVKRADGNMLYLVSWARALKHAVARRRWRDVRLLADRRDVPDRLADLFQLFVLLLRDAAGNHWSSAYRPVLGVLAIARGPVTARQITVLAGLAGSPERALADMHQFLTVRDGRFGMFHRGFAEYLTAEETRAETPELWIDPTMSNRATAARLIAAYGGDWAACTDEYALANIIHHLASALHGEQSAEDHLWCAHALNTLLADAAFVARKTDVVGATPMIADCAIAYNAARRRFPEPAGQLPRTLATHILANTGHQIRADTVQAGLGYRAEFEEFYDQLLSYLADREFVTATVPPSDDPDHAPASLWADYAHCLVSSMRRKDDLERADALLGAVAEVRGPQSKTRYERGYILFLHGQVDQALSSLMESVEAAHQSGHTVGAWISRLVHDQIALFAGRVDPAEYAATLDDALEFFTGQAAGDVHSARWVMNVHDRRLTLACLTADAAGARQAWESLRDDEWTHRERPEFITLWDARTALAAGVWDRARDRYAELLGPHALDQSPPAEEGIAWKLLDYGRALAGTGDTAAAVRAWRQVLRCADSTASWPWKPRARELLAAAGETP